MAMSRSVIYSDPRYDITADVIKWLNYFNERDKGPKPTKNPTTTTPASGPAAAPAAAAAPASDTRVR